MHCFHLNYLVLWCFAPKWFQMMSSCMKLAHYYWIFPSCLCEMLYRWKTLAIFFFPGKLILPTETLSERSFLVHISSLLCSLWQIKLEDFKGIIGCERETSCLSLGGNNKMLPLCISLSFPNSVNISFIEKSTHELSLNSSNVLLLLWVECRDDFRSRPDVAGDVRLLAICAMKEFLLFEKLFWLYDILPLGELVWKLNCDCTCVSKFSCNKHSFVFGLKLWEDVWILAFNKTVKSLTSLLRKVFSLSASSSFTF